MTTATAATATTEPTGRPHDTRRRSSDPRIATWRASMSTSDPLAGHLVHTTAATVEEALERCIYCEQCRCWLSAEACAARHCKQGGPRRPREIPGDRYWVCRECEIGARRAKEVRAERAAAAKAAKAAKATTTTKREEDRG